MKQVELQLFVNGKPVPTYGHDGRTFVEGREGKSFSIRVKNNTAARVEAVVSVDGRSVLDGETSGPNSRGYIIPAYGSYEIPGWRVDTEKCAKFIFKKPGESYAVKSGSESTDVGVVGLMAWSEKPAPQPIIIKEKVIEKYEPWPWYRPYPYYQYTTIDCSHNSNQAGGILRSMSISSRSADNSANTSYSAQCSSAVSSVSAINCSAPSFELGTGWGEATENKVTMTSFDRGTVIEQSELYYSTAKALEKVGIKLKKEVAVPSF